MEFKITTLYNYQKSRDDYGGPAAIDDWQIIEALLKYLTKRALRFRRARYELIEGESNSIEGLEQKPGCSILAWETISSRLSGEKVNHASTPSCDYGVQLEFSQTSG